MSGSAPAGSPPAPGVGSLPPPAGDPAASPRFGARLGVTSDVPHWTDGDGRPLAYEPYVREMNLWGELFSHVEILAPAAEGPIRGSQVPYAAPNIRWRPIDYPLANGRAAQAARLVRLPSVTRAVHGLIRRSDLVHLRSPGHLSLVGRLVANALGAPTITKWAGPFYSHPGERLTARFERAHVRRGPDPALVYAPAERSHLVPFFPATMSEVELRRAASLSSDRRWEPPWRILAVGRLHPDKHFDLAVEGLGHLRETHPDLPWTFTLLGDGSERARLERAVDRLGLRARVVFAGNVPFREVHSHYAGSHVVIMPGTTEGWPKVINEAWAHGAVPVVAGAGVAPWILRQEDSGVTFDPTPSGLARTLSRLLREPDRMGRIGGRGPELAAELSLEQFQSRLADVLTRIPGLA